MACRKRTLLICILISVFVFAGCSKTDSSSETVEQHYNYEHRDFIDSSNENTRAYTDFSNGCIIDNADVYRLACVLIENSVCKSYEDCSNKESMSKEIYESMKTATIQGQQYIDKSFRYEIKCIRHCKDKLEIEYLRGIKYTVDSKVEQMESKTEAPCYICMKYTDNKWVVEYYDYPKGHG